MGRGFLSAKRAMVMFAFILFAGILRDAGLLGFWGMLMLALSPHTMFFLWDKFRVSKNNLAQP